MIQKTNVTSGTLERPLPETSLTRLSFKGMTTPW